MQPIKESRIRKIIFSILVLSFLFTVALNLFLLKNLLWKKEVDLPEIKNEIIAECFSPVKKQLVIQISEEKKIDVDIDTWRFEVPKNKVIKIFKNIVTPLEVGKVKIKVMHRKDERCFFWTTIFVVGNDYGQGDLVL